MGLRTGFCSDVAPLLARNMEVGLWSPTGSLSTWVELCLMYCSQWLISLLIAHTAHNELWLGLALSKTAGIMKFIVHTQMTRFMKVVFTSLLCHLCKRQIWKSSQLMYLFFSEAPTGVWASTISSMVCIFKNIGRCVLDLEYFLWPKLYVDDIYSYFNHDDQDGLGCSCSFGPWL